MKITPRVCDFELFFEDVHNILRIFNGDMLLYIGYRVWDIAHRIRLHA